MLAFTEYERGMIVERTQTGKAVARQDPNFKDGRPKKFTLEQISLALDLLEQGKTYRQITAMTGISKSTLIRARKTPMQKLTVEKDRITGRLRPVIRSLVLHLE